MSHIIHVVIVSWDGYHRQAHQIAREIEPAADRLSVIYSNQAETPETGPGNWVQVPQSWFFGKKFRKSLDFLAPGETMLQIQADATSTDWAGLATACRHSLMDHPGIGIWSPDVHWTPWPSDIVGLGHLDGTRLLQVQQTDGIVWALTPEITDELRTLNYDRNNLGWGIDWAAICIAQDKQRIAVRDESQSVEHPESRGYNGGEASQHMKNFISQFPADRQTVFLLLHSKFQKRKSNLTNFPNPGLAQNPALETTMMNEYLMSITQKFRTDDTRVSSIIVRGGEVFVKAIGENVQARLALKSGNREVPFSQMERAPALSGIPKPFPLMVIGSDKAYQQLDNLGEWQIEAWNTLRVIPDFQALNASLPLGGSLEVPAGADTLELRADLACHRAQGSLIAVLSDMNNHILNEIPVPFNAEYLGGDSPDTYQPVRLRLPAAAQPRLLSLRINSLKAPSATETDPAVFFVARPRLIIGQADPNLQPIILDLGDSTIGEWYQAKTPSGVYCARDGLILTTGKVQTSLLAPDLPGIRLLEDWGHVLSFNLERALQAVAWINNKPAFPIQMDPGHNVLRLPVEALTGLPGLLELRDATGTQVFWKNWILPRRQVTPVPSLQAEARGPYSNDLFPQSPSRFASLRKQLEVGRNPEEIIQISGTISTLEAGYDNLKLKPLVFEPVENPDVSVVIPAHNKVAVTYACMAALLLAHNNASFEVILVDDASTDQTATFEDIVSGITVIHNEEAQRFIRACNAGVEKARGKYLVLLNNDTEPTSGWLDELIAGFDRFPNVGLTGSKLLYPDGSLQDAGGIIWGSGDPWNYGNGQNPWDPRFSYARQADYLSGAAMMTTKAIWDEVGGLSSYLEPMYFEDTDFAFKVRDAGYTTWFIPASVVYHYEGMTSGTSTSSGFKRFQEVNRPKFKRRWVKDYRNFSKKGTAPDLEKDRGIVGRVLFIDYTTPTSDQSAGSYAALEEIKLVQSLGYKVTFLPENLAYLGKYTHELEKMGVEMIISPFYQTIDEFLNARGEEFDAFYITRYHVANAVVPKIRAVNPEAQIIMNNADLHYLRMLRKAVAEQDEGQMDGMRTVREHETAAMRSVDLVLSYNDKEHAVIEAQSEGSVQVMTCPWVLDAPAKVPPRKGRKGLSFLGGFQHHPNVEGVEWFAQSVMERLANERPDLNLSIYGSRMGADVKALKADNIDPVGFVEELAYAYDRHLVFVAPLRSGAGIKGKVLSALAHGIPCVLSPMAAEGIGLRNGLDAIVVDTPAEWIDAIIRVHDDAELWKQLSQSGHTLAKTQFSFESGREKMRAAFEKIGLFAHSD
ncbi:glycosyltransferase [Pseudophaeobacter sp.]|uniref:glycosyltransferase n=1 Tax=Pseudophaeobacter sp. TaxID=1971739 RepID=UPI004058CF3D